jgi:hypothetical protein
MRSGRTGHSEVIHARSTEIGAVPEISVENRDYHYQSQNATVLGLLVISGFINIYPADALDVANRLDELKLD